MNTQKLTLRKFWQTVAGLPGFIRCQLDVLNNKGSSLRALLLLPISGLIFHSPALAQIAPDNTLGAESSVVTPNVLINGNAANRLDGGAIRGVNLFHSFQEFNIPPGQAAYFTNPAGIANILTRVTGNNPSNIFGTLGVLGNANLFLLNPNGMIFGSNARLDLRGSFLASSASSVVFNGFEFSTVNPQTPPLLTINTPIGLGFRENPGTIVVTGPGHNVRIDPQTGTFDYRNRPVGLQVDPNQTLALVGGEVVLTGGNLTAVGGRIELGSLGGAGLVNLTPLPSSATAGFALDYTGASNFGEIRLAPVASATTRGERGGAIQVQGRRVAIAQGSIIDSSTLGTGSGGNLTIWATEAVELSGTIPGTPIPSFLLAQVQPGATNRGGDITIETQRLRLTDGGQISAITFGRGDAGNLTICATEATELLGTSPDGRLPSGLFLFVQPIATGRGGNLTIETPRLLVAGGAQIRTSTLGQGDAGALTVRAQTIELLGTAANGFIPSGLFADVGPPATGNGGDLRLETQRLLVADGALVSTGTFGAGSGGNLTVIATEVELRGSSANGRFFSGLFTSVEQAATGNGGRLTLETQRLRVVGGAQIRSSTLGRGDAGPLTVQAQTIEVSGTAANGQIPSTLSAAVGPQAIGNGSELLIETQRLRVTDGAQIGSVTGGQGNSGNLTIRAEEIEVRGTRLGGQFSGGLFATVEPTGIGRGGTLLVETDRLQVSDGGKVEVATFGQGDAGDLIVRANENIQLSGAPEGARFASGLYGTVFLLPELGVQGRGQGGTLSITTPRLQIENGARIAVSDQSGVEGAGNMTIDAGTIRLNNRAMIEANTIAGSQGSITLNATDIQLRQGSTITTNAGANATGGNITINSEILVAFPGENSDIAANAQGGRGGRIEINVPSIFGINSLTREQLAAQLSPNSALNPQLLSSSDITAISEAGAALSGEVIFNTAGVNPAQGLVELPQDLVDAASLVANNPCARRAGSEFVVTGRGGLPEDPRQALRSQVILPDFRPNANNPVSTNTRTTAPPKRTQPDKNEEFPEIVEATGWVVNAQGNIELVANSSTMNRNAWTHRMDCPPLN